MNDLRIIKNIEVKFTSSGIETARIDALALLGHITGLDKTKLVAGSYFLSDKQTKLLKELVERRAYREPLAYILENKEFYGRDFYVDKNVLIPRPESESMIELALGLGLEQASTSDIGCGSGCLGITYALETKSTVQLIDVSGSALETAKRNVETYGVKAKYMQLDIFDESTVLDRYLLLANLPYVPENDKYQAASPELNSEPRIALYSGKDGLDHYRRLIDILGPNNKCVIVESLLNQQPDLDSLAGKASYKLHSRKDLASCYMRI